MEIRAAEISKVIKDQIAGFGTEAQVSEVGSVLSVGDIVLYSKYGGTEVKYNGEEYLVLSDRDVLAIVEK